MKRILFPILSLLIFVEVEASNFFEGDTLFVATLTELNLRSQPNTKSKIVAQLTSHDTLIVLNTFEFEQKDTISNWTGNWIYVSSRGFNGYVFDSYVTRFPKFSDFSLYDGFFSPMTLSEYAFGVYKDSGCQITYHNGANGESSHTQKFTQLDESILLIEHSYWEGRMTELELSELRYSELYFLINFFIGESNYDTVQQLSFEDFKNGMASEYGFCVAKPFSDCLISVHRKGKNKYSLQFTFPCC